MAHLARLLGAGLLLGLARALPAQEPRGYELGLQGIATFAEPEYGGAGLYAAVRPGGKARVAVDLGAGVSAARLAGRGELSAQFLLSPGRPRGVGLYGLAGVAGTIGPAERAYLVLGLGLEAGPGGGNGWAVEVGVGGGVRLAAGWRWRFFRSRSRGP